MEIPKDVKSAGCQRRVALFPKPFFFFFFFFFVKFSCNLCHSATGQAAQDVNNLWHPPKENKINSEGQWRSKEG